MTLATVSLALGDLAAIGSLVAAGTSVTLIYVRSVAKRVDRIEVEVATVRDVKLDKTDWVRVVAAHTNRQDHMSRQLAELGGKLDMAIGVTAGLNQIAQAVKDKRS